MYLDEAIDYRRSVREFRTSSVDPASIIKILDAGRKAPSAKNSQPWTFFVVTDKRVIAAISKTMLAIAKKKNLTSSEYTIIATAESIAAAPVLICVYTSPQKAWPISDYISIGACLENMCLKATDLGLGSLIVCDGWCAESEINDLIGCRQQLAAILAVGYALKEGRPAKKKELGSIVNGIDIVDKDVIDDLPKLDDSSDKNYVFISYCHEDKKAVLRDIIELKKLGISLWYDRAIAIGCNWDDTALAHLNNERCKGMILYVSEHSLVSENVERELIDAVEVKKLSPLDNSIITVHIGNKPISQYGVEIASCFKKYLSDSKVYIPRGYNASGNTFSIKEAVESLGVIYESGLYDDIKVRRVDGGIEITQYCGASKNVTIATEMGDLPIVSIGKNAFSNNDTIECVTLPSTLKRIEEGAFLGCSELRIVNIPNGVEYIGTAAFRDCVALINAKLPLQITVLSEAIFRGCSALEACAVPYGVVEFQEAVFRDCSSLAYVSVPNTVKRMTDGGFYGCCALKELDIPEDIEGLGKHSFDTCPLLTVNAGGYVFKNGKGKAVNKR